MQMIWHSSPKCTTQKRYELCNVPQIEIWGGGGGGGILLLEIGRVAVDSKALGPSRALVEQNFSEGHLSLSRSTQAAGSMTIN